MTDARNVAWGSASRYGTVASASAVALPDSADVVNITGTTTISTVTGGYAGRVISFVFAASLTVNNGTGANNIKLAGAVNFAATADDVLNIVYDGTVWREASRSVN